METSSEQDQLARDKLLLTECLALTGIRRLFFPASLEQDFIAYNANRMRSNLQNHWKELAGIYLGFSFMLLLIFPINELGYFPWIMALLFLGLMIRTYDSHLPQFDPYTETFTCIGGGLAMAAVLIGVSSVSDETVQAFSMIGSALITIGLFTFLKLRLKTALLAACLAAIFFLLFSWIFSLPFDPLYLLGYFLAPCTFGASIAYLNEYQERTVFLQEKLLMFERNHIQTLYENLQELSVTDYLTGLKNRRFLNEMLEHEWSRCSRTQETLAIIFLDIDYFKQFNDHYGHEAGDIALQAVAKVLKSCAARKEDIVSRYGGEEFVLVIPNSNREKTTELLKKIQNTLAQAHIEHNKSQVSNIITVSMGIYNCIPPASENYSTALKKADEALYEAKENGRNQWCFV